MCSESRNLFKFGKISDNISKTVQDGDIVEIKRLSNGTIANDLE